MKSLTREEAELCARRCGWTYYECVREHGTWGRLLEPACWKDAEGKWVPHTCVITNCGYDDPYFWFGRLWDKLEGLTEGWEIHLIRIVADSYCISVMRKDNNGYPKELKTLSGYGHNHPCLALCEAIEQLKGE